MRLRSAVLACLLVLALVHARTAAADQDRPQRPAAVEGVPRLLDIPFVPQSEALCGGAAVAMVLRYWNAAPVYAEDFAPLVSERAEGISIGDLTRAVRARGWRALPFPGTPDDLQEHLAAGRPVIAIIEDAPGRNHYVVVVGWARDRVVFHDPARGPFRDLDERAFRQAWEVTGRTALLILPADTTADDSSSVAAPAAAGVESYDDGEPGCRDSLREAVALAHSGNLSGADALLTSLREACASSSGPTRELAGIRFLQKRWSDVAHLSAEAVARDPSDSHAWQLLASARFLQGDVNGALAAWNQREEPRVDLMRIEGLDRTPHGVVADAVHVAPETVLTQQQLQRAAKRVAALPTVQMSRVTYSPAANGRATVEVAIVERPLVPTTWPNVVVGAVRAATAHEIGTDIASPTGNGELWTVNARWAAERPSVGLALAVPRIWRWTGEWQVAAFWERETYEGVSRVSSDRRRAAVSFADWSSGTIRWELSGALDHWKGRGNQFAAGAAVERRSRDDRLAARVEGAVWPKVGRSAAFASGALTSAWRSSSESWSSWTGRAGLYVVSSAAPLDVWPAADTGHVRAPLLRAHPLLSDRAIPTERLGRVLTHGTLEYHKRLITRPLGQFGVAAFVDVAKLARTTAGSRPPFQIDPGVGFRASLPGVAGLLRVDLARGIRDGHMALSAAWQPSWPHQEH